jgi:gliding motility-associated-like protein
MKYKLLFILLLAAGYSRGQIFLYPTLVSSAGNAGMDLGSPDFNVSWSVGEPCITTITNGTISITQGFHQPLKHKKVVFQIDTIFTGNSRCQTANNGWAKVVASGGSGQFSYEWSPISSNKDSVFGLQEGNYNVVVTDTVFHTSDTATAQIKLESQEACDIIIYKGFSPNGDDKNDAWIIDGIDLFKNNEVSIFNRYGTIVYSAKNYDNTTVVWKGEYQQKGTPLPEGTYYYVVTLFDKLDNGRYKGWVEITK